MLEHESPIPLYYQIEKYLREKIDAQVWPPGTTLPSERELCQTFSVSKGPVRQAIKNLERAGLARAVQGKGVIINEKHLQPNPLANASFFKEIERLGMKPSSLVIKKEEIYPAPEIAGQLQLENTEKVILIKRLIRGDNLPLAVAVTYLPETLFPNLKEEDLTEMALYDLIVKKYNLAIKLVKESFEPVLPDKEEIILLGLESPLPSLLVRRTIYSDKRPVDYTTLLVKPDRCRYTLEIITG